MIINKTDLEVLKIDKLTYAGHLESLESIADLGRYQFDKVDICDAEAISRIYNDFEPVAIKHQTIESHVDRSIDGSAKFIKTYVNGTHVLLEETK